MPTSVPSSMPAQSVAYAWSWEELSDKTDDELRSVFAAATKEHSLKGRVALLAVGGYGRRELAPFSDLDVVLVHEKKHLDPAFAQALWYPLWDSGHKVGHAVRMLRETVAMVRDDIDTATSIVTARVIAGDAVFGEKVIAKSLAALRRRSREWTKLLHASVLERHRSAGEVAYLLEPDLKNGLGGLRDIHAMWWARAVGLSSLVATSKNSLSATKCCFAFELRCIARRGALVTCCTCKINQLWRTRPVSSMMTNSWRQSPRLVAGSCGSLTKRGRDLTRRLHRAASDRWHPESHS